MLPAITVLLLFQLIGEVIAQVLRLPIPGPVVGMGLLFAALAVPGVPAKRMREPAQQLLQHLSLLFVPAGVGVMLHFHRVAAEWLPIVAALVMSTMLTIVVAAVTTQWLARRLNRSGRGT
ncbi:MAG TPA: CidA/LrgA family protein, partial [Burkholderiales bacterium]|jgi:holin-like protein